VGSASPASPIRLTRSRSRGRRCVRASRPCRPRIWMAGDGDPTARGTSRGLVAERTRAQNRLRWHLVELCPRLEASIPAGAFDGDCWLERIARARVAQTRDDHQPRRCSSCPTGIGPGRHQRRTTRLHARADTDAPTARECIFNRRARVGIQAAPTRTASSSSSVTRERKAAAAGACGGAVDAASDARARPQHVARTRDCGPRLLGHNRLGVRVNALMRDAREM
jgi:hypothetical protein